ncbi:uncharacterized protein BT62DRAFT_1010971 [Guyanagaster necrorhizus]|uniref:Uncharacterized protein n=1 Tax=Guyanagaster necrorhizus TaxID=856835 RepID=A0A9P8ANN6_9AGAR|nr:uncharacterized protein BT62DRAFT_1010971 [Guyanagaster necrorhizus MCA 3950]KAG7441936.1 hypothetical protein BT62DRAFT_1010971 [Guyanagaster necrorhizus MCA 3950]
MATTQPSVLVLALLQERILYPNFSQLMESMARLRATVTQVETKGDFARRLRLSPPTIVYTKEGGITICCCNFSNHINNATARSFFTAWGAAVGSRLVSEIDFISGYRMGRAGDRRGNAPMPAVDVVQNPRTHDPLRPREDEVEARAVRRAETSKQKSKQAAAFKEQASYLKLRMYQQAEECCDEALKYDPKSVKARYRRGVARHDMFAFKLGHGRACAKLVPRGIPDQFVEQGCDPQYLNDDDDDSFFDPPLDFSGKTLQSDSDTSSRCTFSPEEHSTRDELGRNVLSMRMLALLAVHCAYAHSKEYLPEKGWWSDEGMDDHMKGVSCGISAGLGTCHTENSMNSTAGLRWDCRPRDMVATPIRMTRMTLFRLSSSRLSTDTIRGMTTGCKFCQILLLPPTGIFSVLATTDTSFFVYIIWPTALAVTIEDKLEKLGVERVSGSNAPHARAASISSPADPALLLFKLNKLQQSQNASSNNSMVPSPQLSFGMSPSPHQQGPRFMMNRHGHSMSLAQPPTQSLYPYNNGPLVALNPFGHDAVLGSDQIPSRSPHVSLGSSGIGEIHAPQGRVPVALPSLAPPALSTSRPDSRPDFNGGFGLDILEEEEEVVEGENMTQTDSDEEAFDQEVDDDEDRGTEDAGLTTASQGQRHSRHTSKLSAALSLRSFGVFNVDGTNERTDLEPVADGNISVEEKHDLDGVGGQRARQQRLERGIRRRALQQDAEQPRRIPNFPRPPENTMVMSVPGEADIISNPSEEEQLQDHEGYLSVHNYYERPPNMSGRSSRPLPPPPHSRSPSGQHSIHDPAQAHSHHSSDVNFGFPEPKPAVPRLNPNAKPDPFTGSGDHTHSRFPSFGKLLNASAQEFKPSTFTSKAVGPAFPLADPFRPLPVPPVSESSPFRVQGCEKCRRHGSNESMEEGDSMASFNFPLPADSPVDLCQIPLPRPDRSGHSSLNPSVEPFTFAGFSAVATLPPIPPADPVEETFEDESTARAEYGDSQTDAFVLPSSSKAKRAPIPLDFRHTVSNNTVSTGLFKALVNNGGDERTRRTVRSVPAISHKVSRSRLVTDPGQRPVSPAEDVFGSTRHSRRRSSFPDALHPFPSGSSISETSVIHKDLTSRFELHKIEDLLDEKIAVLRHDRGGSTLNRNTEATINEVLSLFRTQLRDSATRSLEDTQLDARGELDFQLIKDVIEQAHAETLVHLKQELSSISQTFDKGRPILNPGVPDVTLEQYGTRTIQAINEAISEMSVRLESIGRAAPARERDAIVDAVVSALFPVLSSIRSDSVDYDYLSEKLSHAVKPNISQLIDLASDKRETVGPIVKQLIPLLPNLQEPSPAVDTDAISLQLTSAVTRAIAPIDAFEIKEQVADLVVERLDVRLANRDKTFTVDGIASRVTDRFVGRWRR